MLSGLASGWLGLIIGGVIGLIFTVMFEDKMKVYRNRFGRRIARKTRGNREFGQDCFQLGPLSTDCIILEGDGENIIKEESIYIAINSRPVELPLELAEWRKEIEKEQMQRRIRGLDFAWNGESYAVERFTVSRTARDEEPEIHLRLRYSDFYTFMATQQLDRRLSDGSTPRQKYLAGRNLADIPVFMNTPFGVNIIVVTRDNQVIISRRSSKVFSFPGVWSVSANEAVSRSIDSQGRAAPNLYSVARRGLREELALEADEYRLDMLEVHISAESNLWGCAFIARLNDLSAEELRQRWSRGRADPWEHDEHKFLPFVPQIILEFVIKHGLRREFTPMGPALFYLSLVNEFGRAKVDHTLKKVSRSLERKPGYQRLSFDKERF